jgi:hypothetical protein
MFLSILYFIKRSSMHKYEVFDRCCFPLSFASNSTVFELLDKVVKRSAVRRNSKLSLLKQP